MESFKYIAEFIGTLVFLTIILKSGSSGNNQPFVIAFGLLGAILLMGNVSGGHFNPAVSVMSFVNNELSSNALFFYVLAQLLGGVSAIQLAKMV